MAKTTRLELAGAKELDEALAALGSEVSEKIGAASIRKAGRTLQAELVDAAPFNPSGPTSKAYGHLRENLRVRRVKAAKPFMIRFQVTTGRAFWGSFLEWGTVRMSAKPWARPTFDRMQAKLLDLVLDTLRVGTARAMKRAARKFRPRRGKIGHNGGPAMKE